ncbi:MAG: serine/threonine protein kinase [Phycisphaeraceae bacterium]|nr:serine/threonine protein kinase [Phycisphaerales bacterium]QOJ16599.1 MAG: serine/threonine protein kinase [Phycisphaeraceae bacterium]
MEGATQSDRWERVQELFHAACERAPRDRGEYLDGACGSDPALRAEVEALLATHDSTSDGLLDAPLVDVAVKSRLASGPPTLVGRRIGHYLVRSVIASGGMGTVYSAEQDSPRRTVALKVMRQSALSRSALRRFRDEAEILARLRHPNIAQVYEAGVHDDGAGGLPYFVMEFIPDARTLTEYARTAELNTRARLDLFARVCDAVHHGHQKGIIHRDLKPGNILVDGEGAPKVIDFGVARSTDADVTVTTQRTDMGQLIGTMQYMSPEQCDGDAREIDTRSDVYALGVVLYELLSERLPYNAGSTTIVQAVMTIRETTPPPLSTLRREFRGDIETIVSRAMAKDRAKRYQSAAELAADIRRHLRGEPIEARRPGRWARAVRWVARRPLRSAAALAMVIVGSSVGLSYGTVWWLNGRAALVVAVPSQQVIRVVSVTGKVIHQLDIHSPYGRMDWNTGTIRSSESGGRGNLAFVCGDEGFAAVEHDESLLIYDLHGSWTNPSAARQVRDDEIPKFPFPNQRPMDEVKGSNFTLRCAMAVDVFPDEENPGTEILAVHLEGKEGVVVLRLYDLDLNVLWEAWHWGHINHGVVWDAERRCLYLAGLNVECFSIERGVSGLVRHPPVVFAIEPKLGEPMGQWIRTPDIHGTILPRWYRTIGPVELWSQIEDIRVIERNRDDPSAIAARVLLDLDNHIQGKLVRLGSLSLALGAQGAKVDATIANNQYIESQQRLAAPSSEVFELVDLPPIQKWNDDRPGPKYPSAPPYSPDRWE